MTHPETDISNIHQTSKVIAMIIGNLSVTFSDLRLKVHSNSHVELGVNDFWRQSPFLGSVPSKKTHFVLKTLFILMILSVETGMWQRSDHLNVEVCQEVSRAW